MLAALAGVIVAPLVTPVAAQGTAASTELTRRHAMSLLGDPKYAAGFKQFDYVNPAAPKGGRVRRATVGTFDSFNPVLYRG